MDDGSSWSVDRVAASNLLAELKLEADEDQIARVAQHFARHRQDAIGWAGERAKERMIQRLENASTRSFIRENEAWTSGFRAAEHEVLTMDAEDLLNLGPDQLRSKGQILRTMVRQAKRSLNAG